MKTLLASLLVLALAACAATRADPAAMTAAPDTPADPASVLTGYHWQLDDAVDAAGEHIRALLVRPARPVTLTFSAGGVSVQNACNAMHAQYTLTGGTLELGHFLSTMMACANPALSALDHAIERDLRGPLAIAIDTSAARPRLTLTTASDQRLTFSGTPTARTRYGSEGQVLFLEVAAQPVACMHGAPGAQCLDVRQVHYSAQGLRQGEPGPWYVLDQPIEGYTHRPGTRNILRVQRYRIAHPDRHGADVAYVLDAIIESEPVPPAD